MVVVSFHPGRPQSGAAAIIAGSQAETDRPKRFGQGGQGNNQTRRDAGTMLSDISCTIRASGSWALVVTAATVNYRLGKAGNNAVGPCMI